MAMHTLIHFQANEDLPVLKNARFALEVGSFVRLFQYNFFIYAKVCMVAVDNFVRFVLKSFGKFLIK